MYLISSVRFQAVASHPSPTVLVRQQRASSRDFGFGFGAAPGLRILAQSLSDKLRPLEPGGLSLRANVNKLLPCVAAQKLLCHFSCVLGHWVEQYTWAFGKDWAQVLVVYTRCQSSAWSIPFPCACPVRTQVTAKVWPGTKRAWKHLFGHSFWLNLCQRHVGLNFLTFFINLFGPLFGPLS